MPKRNHPEYYYAIRDVIMAGMGPEFDQTTYYRLFPKAAAPHKVIPHTDGYLAHRRIIRGLVKARMRTQHRNAPKVQLSLA